MPFISIIIIAWNNEEYIVQAIQSCLQSNFSDIEVIIINNGSTDKTKKLIEEVTINNFGFFKVIQNKKNQGPGEARNIGVSYASGEYLMFLDGDDWLETKAIDIVLPHLLSQKPDILMFNHYKVFSDGCKIQNIPHKYADLGQEDKDLTIPSIRRGAIRNIHVAWNKVYKSEFIKNLKIKYPHGYYEDLYWSICSTVEANTLFYINDIIYNYRQNKNSITKTFNNQHLDIFKQIKKIEEKLKKSNNYKSYYKKEIQQYLKDQIFGIYRSNCRIRENDKKEFICETKKYLKKINHGEFNG